MTIRKNYIPGSMSFAAGFLGGRSGRGVDMLVDEEKAREIVRGLLAAGRPVTKATLGLDGDWRENSTIIYGPDPWADEMERKPDAEGFRPYDAYRGSYWATPTLIVEFSDAPSEAYECWRTEKADHEAP